MEELLVEQTILKKPLEGIALEKKTLKQNKIRDRKHK